MRNKILAGIVLAASLGLSGCTALEQQSPVSPVGSWGAMSDELLDLNHPWISFANDGTLTASDGGEDCYGFSGAWEQKGSELILRHSLDTFISCDSEAVVSSATKAEVSEESVTLIDSRGSELTEIPFLNSNPGLYKEAFDNEISEAASDAANLIEGANGFSD